MSQLFSADVSPATPGPSRAHRAGASGREPAQRPARTTSKSASREVSRTGLPQWLLPGSYLPTVTPRSPTGSLDTHICLVPRANGGWRPVLDLSALNRFLQRIPFCMETAASVRDAIRHGDYVTSLDLPDLPTCTFWYTDAISDGYALCGRAGQGRAGQSVSVLGAPLRPFLGPLGFHQSSGSFTAGRGACESTCIWTTGGLTGPVSYPRPSASTAGRSSGVRHQRCQVGGYPISDVLLSRYKFQYEGASGPVSRVGLAVRR